jgi:hypothetical protein
MNKYYELSDKTPAYVAAIVLHPGRKWKYIKKNWKVEWVSLAKTKMREF